MSEKEKRITSQDVIAALRMRFCSPQFAFLEQVADGTGARRYRWADAVAMSVWPSRGYDIHGIEVKVSRYDWLSEMRDPAKSAAVQKYCNRWWLAIGDEKIVQPGELPPTWGLLVLKGGAIKCAVEAPLLTPEALSVEFVASVLRNMASADDAKVAEAFSRGREEGYKAGEKNDYTKIKLDELTRGLAEFQEKSGIEITRYSGGDIGQAVSALRHLKYRVDQVRTAAKACEDIKGMLDQVAALEELEEAVKQQ